MAFISQLGDLWQRRPNLVHWTAVGAVALVALVLVSGMTGRARTAAAAWGTSVRVLAAQSPLAVGTSPEGQVDLIEVPAHLVPAGALTSAFELGELTRAVPRGGPVDRIGLSPRGGSEPGAPGHRHPRRFPRTRRRARHWRGAVAVRRHRSVRSLRWQCKPRSRACLCPRRIGRSLVCRNRARAPRGGRARQRDWHRGAGGPQRRPLIATTATAAANATR